MAANSLQIKCWTMAIIGVFITFSEGILLLAGLAPAALFCCLDAKYLSLERSYRDLYDEVRLMAEEEIDYSMHIGKRNFRNGLISWSVLPFYFVLSVAVIFIAIAKGCF